MMIKLVRHRYVVHIGRHLHEYGLSVIPLLDNPHLLLFGTIGASVFLVGIFIVYRIEET